LKVLLKAPDIFAFETLDLVDQQEVGAIASIGNLREAQSQEPLRLAHPSGLIALVGKIDC